MIVRSIGDERDGRTDATEGNVHCPKGQAMASETESVWSRHR